MSSDKIKLIIELSSKLTCTQRALDKAKEKLKCYCEEWSNNCECKACRNMKKIEAIENCEAEK